MGAPTPDKIQEIERRIEAAMTDPSRTRVYINGFHVAYSPGDLTLVGLLAGLPVSLHHMSFSVAKSLMENLKKIITDIEEKSKQEILTMEVMQERLSSGG
jgi:hypothetical protein